MQTQDNLLNKDEQNEIAGLDSLPISIAEEEKLELENDAPVKLATEEKAIPRALFVVGAVGAVVLFGMGFWQFLQPRSIETVKTQKEKVEEETETVEPDYRGRLALRDQQNELTTQPVTQPPETTSKLTPTRISSPPPPRVVTRTITRTVTAPAPQPQYRQQFRQQIVSVPRERVDPFDRWNQLANLGHVKTNKLLLAQPTREKRRSNQYEGSIATAPDKNQTRRNRTRPERTVASNISNNLSATTVSLSSTSTGKGEVESSPGASGILNRRRQNTGNASSGNYEVVFGTSVSGVVSTPLLWDESESPDSQVYKRFSVTLNEDLADTEGRVALPSGTVIVAEASKVNSKNRLVQASAIAIVYKDLRGKTRQIEIAPGTILVGGAANQPLIAKGYFDDGGAIANSDLIVSTLSGIGRVGRVLTEPKSTSTFSSGLFGGYSSTTSQSRDPEIWAAALDGFFTPLADRISERSERQIEELAKRPNVSIVAPNTKVSLVVNSFLTIQR
jgi:hypothetical protein